MSSRDPSQVSADALMDKAEEYEKIINDKRSGSRRVHTATIMSMTCLIGSVILDRLDSLEAQIEEVRSLTDRRTR